MKPQNLKRQRQPWRWRDPRMVIGLLLIVVSVTATSVVIYWSGRGEDYYVANKQLLPGQTITQTDLQVVKTNPGELTAKYLRPVDAWQGQVVTRVIEAGELVPASALGAASQVNLRSVVVPLNSPLPSAVQPGDLVDLWIAPKQAVAKEDGQAPLPRLIAGQARILKLPTDDGGAFGRGNTVEVQIKDGELAAFLAACQENGAISAVPRLL